MKKGFLLILACSILFTGCSILSWPLKFFTELMPMLIQYAPYALMFVEVQEKKTDIQQDIENWNKTNKNIDIQLSQELTKQHQLQCKQQYIIALPFNEEEINKIQTQIMHQKSHKIVQILYTPPVETTEELA
ncbi:MAG TPA: hypothetical protein PLR86_12165, partial [Planctomycetota bacterium]|nr:hypothetical protein [Planctomycetota bacterium]